MVWLPLVAVILGAGGTLYLKHYLGASRIPQRDYLVITMALSACFSVALSFATGQFGGWKVVSLVEPQVLLPYLGYLVVGVGALSFFVQGFRRENLVRYELAEFLDPLAIFVLVGVAFPAERDIRIYLAAGVALAAYALVHFNRKHLSLQLGERLLLLASVFYGLEAVFERFLLGSFEPIELYTLRTVGLAIVFLLLYGLPAHETFRSYRFTGAIGLVFVWFLYHLAVLFSYDQLGVTVTNLALLLMPILLFVWGWFVARDREPWRFILAGLVIIGAVAYALTLVN